MRVSLIKTLRVSLIKAPVRVSSIKAPVRVESLIKAPVGKLDQDSEGKLDQGFSKS